MAEKTFVTFSINNHNYAIDILDIQKIVAFSNVDVKPMKAPACMIGITYFQKKITPILDIEMMCSSHKRVDPSLYGTILFLAIDIEFLGILITQSPKIIELKENDIHLEKPEDSDLSDFVENYAKINNEVYNILNVKNFSAKNTPYELLVNEIDQHAFK